MLQVKWRDNITPTGLQFTEDIDKDFDTSVLPNVAERFIQEIIQIIMQNYQNAQQIKSRSGEPIKASGELGNTLSDASAWKYMIDQKSLRIVWNPSTGLELNASNKSKLEAVDFGTPRPAVQSEGYINGQKKEGFRFGAKVPDGELRQNIGIWMAQKGIPAKAKFPIIQKIMGMIKDEDEQWVLDASQGGTQPANPPLMFGPPDASLPVVFIKEAEKFSPNLYLNNAGYDFLLEIIEDEMNKYGSRKRKTKKKNTITGSARVSPPRIINYTINYKNVTQHRAQLYNPVTRKFGRVISSYNVPRR